MTVPKFDRLPFLCLWGALVLLALSPSPAAAQRRVALVIGNSAYQYTGPLANPGNDAADVASVLRRFGFTVISGEGGLTKSQTDAKLREFADALSGADLGLLFYSGHGLQYQGQNFLIPLDAKLGNSSALLTEAVRLDDVQAIMEGHTKQSVLFFDACRNNPFARSLSTAGRGYEPGLALQRYREGTLIAYAAQPGSVASDGSGRNSPFTGPLVRLLNGSSEDLSSILMQVRKEVLAATGGAQLTWDQNSLTEKLYLRGGGQLLPQPASPIASASPAESSPRATKHSVWRHNGSDLLLQSAGNLRSFYYAKLSADVATAGVKAGTLLFEGKMEGGQYIGTAYRFSSKCPTRAYRVAGPILDEGQRISLKGQVRKLNQSDCSLLAPYVDDLEFTYIRTE